MARVEATRDMQFCLNNCIKETYPFPMLYANVHSVTGESTSKPAPWQPAEVEREPPTQCIGYIIVYLKNSSLEGRNSRCHNQWEKLSTE